MRFSSVCWILSLLLYLLNLVVYMLVLFHFGSEFDIKLYVMLKIVCHAVLDFDPSD